MIPLHTKLSKFVRDDVMPGWSDLEKAQRLASMVVAIRADVSIELGVYGGRSFLGLAAAHCAMAHGTAIAVDPWSNAAATEGYIGENQTFWKNNPLEQIYQGFLKNMRDAEVMHRVQVLRQKSDDVTPPSKIDILHVDGQHTQQAVVDVQRFAINVRVGGFAVMDDVTWANGGDQPVMRAVDELKRLGFVELYPLGTGAVFQRIK